MLISGISRPVKTNEEMKELHNKNAKILNEIIAIDYPTIDKVGKEANEATWLVIQHSIEQPDFMKKCETVRSCC